MSIDKEHPLESIFKNLEEQIEVRTNLSTLRQLIKEEAGLSKCQDWSNSHQELLIGFLSSDDAKTRKNAALLLGDLKCQAALQVLWNTYQNETTLFVRSSYLTALGNLSCEALIPQVKDCLVQLEASEVTKENQKHVDEELRALRKIIIRYEGITTHQFAADGKDLEILLVTNRLHREVVKRELGVNAKLHPLGVLAQGISLKELYKCRSYKEILFPIHGPKPISQEPEQAAKELMASDLMELLKKLHHGEEPFYFRVECKSGMTLEERSNFAKKLASQIERLSAGTLINSTTDYEIELRLIAMRDGGFYPCIKCYTLKDKRFIYRKNAIAASIHPSTAALIMELVKPYLKENAQIMDPFCGVGTMLVERAKKLPVKEIYATDIFGDAIEYGRENAKKAGLDIHFIHRDFFDFKHDYLFDEMITNMPLRGKKTKEEMDLFYGRFFDKVGEHLTAEGIIIMYTNELGFVKKQLRLHSEFELLQESCMQKKNEFYVLVIGVRK